MTDRGYSEHFSIEMTSHDGKKKQKVWEMTCHDCSDCHDDLETKKPITVKCTSLLLTCLLEMMGLSRSVKIRHQSGKTFEVIVRANIYTFEHIPRIIGKMCDYHVYWNISSEDANEIITSLDLSQYVFCVQGDPALGACLVVFQELGLSHYQPTHQGKKEPRTTFREEYEKINQSRTVVMTPSQRDMLLSEKMKLIVEFSSALPDGQIEVVFRREAIQTIVPKIKKQVEIDNLRRRLEELTSSSK
jgi:hypothetical protein